MLRLSNVELITVYMDLHEWETHGMEELFYLGEKGVNEREARIQMYFQSQSRWLFLKEMLGNEKRQTMSCSQVSHQNWKTP